MLDPRAPIYRYMTPAPHTIGRDEPLARAREVMSRFSIRHLPVMDGGVLVGLLEDRDLAVAEKLGDPFQRPVAEVMTHDPYLAVPSTPLAEVADEMAKRSLGLVIVVDSGNVVGVFTAVDALRAIGEVRGDRSSLIREVG